jgi:hypothetical protein
MNKGVAVVIIIFLIFIVLIIGIPYFITMIMGDPARLR